MVQDGFVACRALMTKPEAHDYIVLRRSEVAQRLDVESGSTEFKTEAEAKAEINRLGGTIPTGLSLFLDFFDDDELETVWCWKDERTGGASDIFASEQEALDALNSGKLIFHAPPLE
jgi:hypothetical protein